MHAASEERLGGRSWCRRNRLRGAAGTLVEVSVVQRVADLNSRRKVHVVTECLAYPVVISGFDDGNELLVHTGDVLRGLEGLVVEDEEQTQFQFPVLPQREKGCIAGLLIEIAMERQVLL